ncbi:hypothetical protein AS189_00665 [Arthrobacter alpinus]|uniref:Uncharacterized protein n=1 Tax=Arthrobacter alpinus TaxID=656366 RepID=A0A0S2LUV1_9MICC|nr:hypothetical protein [Arthrobacter alpinus]ALO65268.1 hypothetical protein AS189_00665 [Arthrobacter alpinus]
MSLEDDIHQLVLAMEGVATVYAADPVWLSALKQLGSLVDPGSAAAPVPFVVCSEAETAEAVSDADDGGTRERGAVALGEASSPDAASADGRPVVSDKTVLTAKSVLTVKIRIGTDGTLPAPAMARSVAGAIRTLVTARQPDAQVKAVVEISAIGV